MITSTGSSGEQLQLAHQFPLSLAQERLWRRKVSAPLVAQVYFEGALDPVLFESCIHEEISRHEALRTTIREMDGQQFQFVFETSSRQQYATIDLEQPGEQESARSFDAVVTDASLLPEDGPLFRATLVRLNNRRHCCVIAASPLIFDEYSLDIVLKDLGTLYQNQTAEKKTRLPAPEIQFADYCIWQRQALAEKSFASPIAATVQRLAGFSPTPLKRASYPDAEHSTNFRKLSSDINAKLKGLARDYGHSPARALLAAIALGIASDEPMVIVAHVSGRHHAEVTEVVGPLANKLLLRGPAADASFRNVLRDLQQEWSLAAASADAPYEAVAELLDAATPPWPLAFLELPDKGVYPFAGGITRYVEMQPTIDMDAVLTVLARQDGEESEIAFASDLLGQKELEQKLEAGLALTGLLVSEADRSVNSIAAERAGAQKQHATDEVTATEQKLIDIWAGIFGISSVGIHDDFFDLGGHSLLAVRMAARMERAFGIEVPLYAILEKPTIAELAAFLEQDEPAAEENARHTLVPLQTGGGLAPLYWIPGGRAISVMALREVSLLIGSDRPVYGVESRLPQPGEAFLTVPERAREYIELIQKRQPHGPYLLVGFCMGGMVAFEMAQQLKRDGHEVSFLGMVQATMPGFPAPGLQSRRMHLARNWYMIRTIGEFGVARVAGGLLGYSRQKRQQVLDRVAALLTGWVSTSSQLPEETQRVNSHVMYAYRPAPYPGYIHMFLARDCYESAGIPAALDPRRRWQDIATSGGDVHVLPGNHDSILIQPHARNLAEAIRSSLTAHS